MPSPEAEKNIQPIEIERKYLVSEFPENLSEYPKKKIQQGYLVVGTDGSEVRLRDCEGEYSLTVKSTGDMVRTERQVALTDEQFDLLWPLTDGKRVEKERYSIPFDDVEIQLDIYTGNLEGLVTAEVEFSSVAAAELFNPPEWFGAEVTSESSYKNQNLATRGIPE